MQAPEQQKETTSGVRFPVRYRPAYEALFFRLGNTFVSQQDGRLSTHVLEQTEDDTSLDDDDLSRAGRIFLTLPEGATAIPAGAGWRDDTWDAERLTMLDLPMVDREFVGSAAIPPSDKLATSGHFDEQDADSFDGAWTAAVQLTQGAYSLHRSNGMPKPKRTRLFRWFEGKQSATAVTLDSPASKGDLYAALHDLRQSTQEAEEEGFPVPSSNALANAHRLLREMYKISRRRFEVYPTQDGEVAIDAPGGYGHSVVLLCDSQGGALCLVNTVDGHRRARYSNAEMLPDGFVREALVELEKQSSLAG